MSKQEPLIINDAHHHLWDLDAVDYPWLQAKGIKRFFGDPTPIQKNYLPQDIRNDARQLQLEKSVHIQVGAAPDQHIQEAEWVDKMSMLHGLPNASIAYCDLEKNTCSETLDQLQQLGSLRGIRQIVGRSPEEDKSTGTNALLQDPDWLTGLKRLAKRGLSFDLQLIPDQMEDAYQVFSKIEELPVALCHCGSPWYRDAEGWSLWESGLRKLASLPRVTCKISGLGMFDHNWSITSIKPVIETVLEIFDVERCMFGSNFPVDKLHRDYFSIWQAYDEIVRSYSVDEKQRLFQSNCADFYCI